MENRARIALVWLTGLRNPPLLGLFLATQQSAGTLDDFSGAGAWRKIRDRYEDLEATLAFPSPKVSPALQLQFADDIVRHRGQVEWADQILDFYEANQRNPIAKEFRLKEGPLRVNRDRLFGTGPYVDYKNRKLPQPIFESAGEGWFFIHRRAQQLQRRVSLTSLQFVPADAEKLRVLFQSIAIEMMLDWISREGRTPSAKELQAGAIPDYFDYQRLTATGQYQNEAYAPHRIFDSPSQFWVLVEKFGRERGLVIDLSPVSVQAASADFHAASLYYPARRFLSWWRNNPGLITQKSLLKVLGELKLTLHNISTPTPDWDHVSLLPFWRRVRELAEKEGLFFPYYAIKFWRHADWTQEILPLIREDILTYLIEYARTNSGQLPSAKYIGRNQRTLGFSMRQLLGQEPYNPGSLQEHRAIFRTAEEFSATIMERAVAQNVTINALKEWSISYQPKLWTSILNKIGRTRESRASDTTVVPRRTQEEWVDLTEEFGVFSRLVGTPASTPLEEAEFAEAEFEIAALAATLDPSQRRFLEMLIAQEVTAEEIEEILHGSPSEISDHGLFEGLELSQLREMLQQLRRVFGRFAA